MPSSLPPELAQAAERYLTCELVTIDAVGRPIVWPVTPYFRADEGCIDVTTGVGYPKKADDAARNPRVALLFSDPTGSGVTDAPTVLVQGTARVDDADLDANRERYEREMARKLPALHALAPTGPLKRFFSWYYDRIYLHVRPERVYVWAHGALDEEPTLYDAHVEEVRSGHNEEPEEGHTPPEGGLDVWDPRLDRLGTEDATAVLAIVGPDGFPFAARVKVHADAAAHVVHVDTDPVGAPIEAGPACLCAHAHADDLTWQRSYQVRGDLIEHNGRLVLHPHRVVAGLQLPSSAFERYRVNVRKILHFRRTARDRERARSGAGTAG
jgi:pyridoxamine 5'-phosphate oxidase-like protein